MCARIATVPKVAWLKAPARASFRVASDLLPSGSAPDRELAVLADEQAPDVQNSWYDRRHDDRSYVAG